MVIAEGLPELWYGWVALGVSGAVLALYAGFSIYDRVKGGGKR